MVSSLYPQHLRHVFIFLIVSKGASLPNSPWRMEIALWCVCINDVSWASKHLSQKPPFSSPFSHFKLEVIPSPLSAWGSRMKSVLAMIKTVIHSTPRMCTRNIWSLGISGCDSCDLCGVCWCICVSSTILRSLGETRRKKLLNTNYLRISFSLAFAEHGTKQYTLNMWLTCLLKPIWKTKLLCIHPRQGRIHGQTTQAVSQDSCSEDLA